MAHGDPAPTAPLVSDAHAARESRARRPKASTIRHAPAARPARLVRDAHVTYVRELAREVTGERLVVVVGLYGTLARFDGATGESISGPPSAVRYRLDVAGGNSRG